MKEPGDLADEIKRLETDPLIALAKLRIEFETRLRRLAARVGSERRTRAPLSSLIRELVAREIFPPPFGGGGSRRHRDLQPRHPR